MKKDKRAIQIKLARKSFQRKVRSKMKRKKRRRMLSAMSAQSRFYLLSREFAKRKFINYKWIETPQVFSLTKNTEESLAFISKIDECYSKKRMVFVDTEKTSEIGNGAIAVLLSILVKFKSNKIKFNGNYPKNLRARTAFQKSGLLKLLADETNNIKPKDQYDFKHSIFTHASKKVDAELSNKIIKKACNQIWGEKEKCHSNGIQRVFLELMQNTNNHASGSDSVKHHWWASVSYDANVNTASFSFIDYGIGIFDSLALKKPDQKFYGIKEKLKSIFNINSNDDILRMLLHGKIHEMALNQKYFRGKGLPGIYEAFCKNRISNLVVISNDAKADCANEKYFKLKNKLCGTFVYWELNSDNTKIIRQ